MPRGFARKLYEINLPEELRDRDGRHFEGWENVALQATRRGTNPNNALASYLMIQLGSRSRADVAVGLLSNLPEGIENYVSQVSSSTRSETL